MKEAIGLTISGAEARLAHLVNHKGNIRVLNLESVNLRTPLDYAKKEEPKSASPSNELSDVFGLKDVFGEKSRSEPEAGVRGSNMEILYKLLYVYVQKKAKIAFNIPLSLVNYHVNNQDTGGESPAENGKKEQDAFLPDNHGLNMGHRTLKTADGDLISMTYEQEPPIFTLLREMKEFYRGKVYFGLMDTTEIAIMNLARSNRYTSDGKITVIVHIEDEFTRLVFLKGKDLLHISALIHENAASPRFFEVIARRLIYEQDEAGITGISRILLSGKACRLNALEFFATNFESCTVDYLSSSGVGRLPTEGDQKEVFSEYAVAIAMAWKLLQPKNSNFEQLNLLPQHIRDQQEILKLDATGVVLLLVTGIATFFLTWQIMKVKSEARLLEIKYKTTKEQIEKNKRTIDQVLDMEQQTTQLKAGLSLADSLARGHDELLDFLKALNASVGETKKIWINEIIKQQDGYLVKGESLQREQIPMLADKLGGANLKKVTRRENSGSKVYTFELDRIDMKKMKKSSQPEIRIGSPFLTSNGRPPVRTATPLQNVRSSRMRSGRSDLVTKSRQPGVDAAAKSAPAISPTKSSHTGKLSSLAGATPPERKAAPRTTPGRPKTQKAAPAQQQAPRKGAVAQRINASEPTAAKQKLPGPIRTPSRLSTGKATLPNLASKSGVAPKREVSKSPAPAKTTSLPVAAEKQAADPARIYSVQLASCRTKKLAQQYVLYYRKKGLPAYLHTYFDKEKGTKWNKVLVGKYSSEAQARENLNRIARALNISNQLLEIVSGKKKAKGTEKGEKLAKNAKEKISSIDVPHLPARSDLSRPHSPFPAAEEAPASLQRQHAKIPGIASLAARPRGAALHSHAEQEPESPPMQRDPQKRSKRPGRSIDRYPTEQHIASTEADAGRMIFKIITGESLRRELSEAYANLFRKHGMEAIVEKYYDVKRGTELHRVLIGTFTSRLAAEREAERLLQPLRLDYEIVAFRKNLHDLEREDMDGIPSELAIEH